MVPRERARRVRGSGVPDPVSYQVTARQSEGPARPGTPEHPVAPQCPALLKKSQAKDACSPPNATPGLWVQLSPQESGSTFGPAARSPRPSIEPLMEPPPCSDRILPQFPCLTLQLTMVLRTLPWTSPTPRALGRACTVLVSSRGRHAQLLFFPVLTGSFVDKQPSLTVLRSPQTSTDFSHLHQPEPHPPTLAMPSLSSFSGASWLE
ncbi:uncharacterized protein LOC132213612 [Myotis daubentonii]|uniref:uncharacterized protein LOC132213612 n=1 Tax=Myotis daubentonii TaxID=98922 RepID=UPI0028734132|nr:uncharacterized protein LOC132213612 [Myotis daubentonii]